MNKDLNLPDHIITSKIYLIRNQKVMLDRDLAKLYGVETKQLKRQVRRNLDRFPLSFMFELNSKEFENLRSQIGTLKRGSHSKYAPFAFTEHGILMLSSILNSKKAISMSLHIIETFIQLRKFAHNYDDLLKRINQMKLKNSKKFNEIYKILDKLIIENVDKPRQKIGYKK